MKQWGLIFLGSLFLLTGCMVVVRDIPGDR